MAGKRLGLFKPHHSLFSSACIAPHRNIYFMPYQMKKKIIQREGDVSRNRQSLQGKYKGVSEDPQRQHKVIFREGVLFLFISFPRSVSSYILFGGLSLCQMESRGENHLHYYPDCLTPGALPWYFIPNHSANHYHFAPTLLYLPNPHTHTHIDKHMHAPSLIGSISCNTSTEVQEGQVCDEWREVQGGPWVPCV